MSVCDTPLQTRSENLTLELEKELGDYQKRAWLHVLGIMNVFYCKVVEIFQWTNQQTNRLTNIVILGAMLLTWVKTN